MNPTDNQSSDIDASYSRMTCRLFDKGLQALDCGSSGDCFFKSISHQYYGTPEFHHLIRQAGVHYLEQHPELFIETLTDGSWTTYLKRMAAPGTWCDNNIIQAVANQLNCVIHIIESRISNPEGTTITPPSSPANTRVLFVGYIENLHYVSTMPHPTNKNVLKYLKVKFSQSHEQHEKKLQCRREKYRQCKRTQTQSPCVTKRTCIKNPEPQSSNSISQNCKTTQKQSQRVTKKTCIKNPEPQLSNSISQKEYLNSFDVETHGNIDQQDWAKNNMKKFHTSNNYVICHCQICLEAWPLNVGSKVPEHFKCSRCKNDKELPNKFSKENLMTPSPLPDVLCGLTQVEEMLIARAVPIMHIYIKPGGQRGYSGHTVNLPQDIGQLALLLPRYPKDLSIIIIKAKGKGGSIRNLSVRRQVVSDALYWLIENNPQYSDVQINVHALNSLPENGFPEEILSVEADEDRINGNVKYSPDRGPHENEDDIVYNCYIYRFFKPASNK